MSKSAMLVMYREFSKNPLYTLIGYLHDGCPILDFHHTRLIDHTRLLDTQEYLKSHSDDAFLQHRTKFKMLKK